jgi:drug/metabolite transporter (DMT)-like permease
MSRISNPTEQQVRLALVITAIGGLLFTFDLPLLRLSFADKWTMVFARGIFLFLSITIVWWLSRRRDGSRTPFIAGGAGILVAVTNTIANMAYIGAIVETGAANVVFILALTPVIAAVLSWIILGERVHSWTWLAALVCFLGVGIIAWDGISTGRMLGDVLALVSATCSATAFTTIRASGKNVATSVAVGSLSSALIALIFFNVSSASLLGNGAFDVPAWVWIALNGLLIIPMASVMLANGPRYLPSADVSMFFMLETVLTPVWIWFLFGESPGKLVTIGGGIVIATLFAHSFWRVSSSLRAAA